MENLKHKILTGDHLEYVIEPGNSENRLPCKYWRSEGVFFFKLNNGSMQGGNYKSIVNGEDIIARELDVLRWRGILQDKDFLKDYFFVIETTNQTFCTKVLYFNSESGAITCHFHNPDREDLIIYLKDLKRLFYSNMTYRDSNLLRSFMKS